MKPANRSAYRPPAAVVPPAQPARNPNLYVPDPWPERAEEFYQSIYGAGKCKFCGHPILSWKDICDCDAMKRARDEFKRKIRPAPAAAVPAPVSPAYNPDAFTEPKAREPIELAEPEHGTFL